MYSRILYAPPRQISAVLQKKKCMFQEQCHLFISQKAVTHQIRSLGKNGHSKIKLSGWWRRYIPSNVIKDSTKQSKEKQNTITREPELGCQFVGKTQQWGYSYDSGHDMIQLRPRWHIVQGDLSDSLCSNGICGPCLSCMENLHSGD